MIVLCKWLITLLLKNTWALHWKLNKILDGFHFLYQLHCILGLTNWGLPKSWNFYVKTQWLYFCFGFMQDFFSAFICRPKSSQFPKRKRSKLKWIGFQFFINVFLLKFYYSDDKYAHVFESPFSNIAFIK